MKLRQGTMIPLPPWPQRSSANTNAGLPGCQRPPGMKAGQRDQTQKTKENSSAKQGRREERSEKQGAGRWSSHTAEIPGDKEIKVLSGLVHIDLRPSRKFSLWKEMSQIHTLVSLLSSKTRCGPTMQFPRGTVLCEQFPPAGSKHNTSRAGPQAPLVLWDHGPTPS